MTGRLNIVTVANSFFIISGLSNLVSEFPGLFIAGQYDGSEKHLEEKVLHHKPDLVFLDPAVVQSRLLHLLQSLSGNTMVIGLVSGTTKANVKSHFSNCLDLNQNKHEVLRTFGNLVSPLMTSVDKEQSEAILSGREKMIVKEVVSGLTNQEIADKLFLSIHTVITHRKNITNKLGIKTVSGLTVYALMNKIVSLHEIRQ
jgi:DNA-binding NarL/FixJ family response regulator